MPSAKGDPRRPAEVRPYSRGKGSEEAPPDVYLLASMLAAMSALLLKSKLAAMGSAIFCLIGVANVRSYDVDYKQFVTSFVFAVFGLVSCYLAPMQGKRAGS